VLATQQSCHGKLLLVSNPGFLKQFVRSKFSGTDAEVKSVLTFAFKQKNRRLSKKLLLGE